MASNVANWAIDNYLDGVDFDLENFEPGFIVPGKSSQDTVSWVATLSNAARNILGDSRYITHAPQAPYFGAVGGNSWPGSTGGYTGVYENVTILSMRTHF